MELKNWQNSPYPFKSPHRKSKSRIELFNLLNEKVADKRRLNLGRPRDNPNNQEITESIIKNLDNFSKLTEFTDLSTIERTLPLRDVFVLPAKQGIVIYSVYSMLLSKEKGAPASYERVHNYLKIEHDQGNSREAYAIINLLRDSFKLFTLVKPFRVLLGLPLGPRYLISTPNKKKMNKTQKVLKSKIATMEEWEKISRPGLILTTVYDIVNTHGYQMALQFVRYLFRASSKIRQILISQKPKKIDLERIRSLTERYLTIESLTNK